MFTAALAVTLCGAAIFVAPVATNAVLPQSTALLSTQIREAFIRDGRLRGWTRLTVRATQDLSSFNLDLEGPGLADELAALAPGRPVRVSNDADCAAYAHPSTRRKPACPMHTA